MNPTASASIGKRLRACRLHDEQARAVGIGTKRPATLLDIRMALKAKGLVTETVNGWAIKQPGVSR
jgi:hypothetical protein